MSSLTTQVLELALAIQKIPAPTFQEQQRAAFILAGFQKEGLLDTRIDAIGNVYARIPGTGNAAPIVVSAHLDTVFPTDTNLDHMQRGNLITAPGLGDNSLGVAGLFGLLWGLREQAGVEKTAPLPCQGDIWLVANIGEEGLGNLRGMEAVVDQFGSKPQAYLVLEGMAYEQVYHRGLGVKRYRISVCTPGGHSWGDFGRPSAIHELASLITQLTAQPLPTTPRTTLNVGVIAGGTTVNTIAAEAYLELDLRSEDPHALSGLVATVETLAQEACRNEVKVTAEVIGERPAGSIPTNHPLVQLAVRCLEAQGSAPHLTIGSTDANIPLSRGLPAICLGLTRGSNAHTIHETIEIPPLANGLGQLIDIVSRLLTSSKD